MKIGIKRNVTRGEYNQISKRTLLAIGYRYKFDFMPSRRWLEFVMPVTFNNFIFNMKGKCYIFLVCEGYIDYGKVTGYRDPDQKGTLIVIDKKLNKEEFKEITNKEWYMNLVDEMQGSWKKELREKIDNDEIIAGKVVNKTA